MDVVAPVSKTEAGGIAVKTFRFIVSSFVGTCWKMNLIVRPFSPSCWRATGPHPRRSARSPLQWRRFRLHRPPPRQPASSRPHSSRRRPHHHLASSLSPLLSPPPFFSLPFSFSFCPPPLPPPL